MTLSINSCQANPRAVVPLIKQSKNDGMRLWSKQMNGFSDVILSLPCVQNTTRKLRQMYRPRRRIQDSLSRRVLRCHHDEPPPIFLCAALASPSLSLRNCGEGVHDLAAVAETPVLHMQQESQHYAPCRIKEGCIAVHNTCRFKEFALFRVTSWLSLFQHILPQCRLSHMT